jgi:hypothetical protein
MKKMSADVFISIARRAIFCPLGIEAGFCEYGRVVTVDDFQEYKWVLRGESIGYQLATVRDKGGAAAGMSSIRKSPGKFYDDRLGSL